MNTKTHTSTAERFGCWLGRGWRGYLRRERQVSGWLVAQGLPERAGLVLMWIVKLVVLSVLLYTAFWLALLVLFAMILGRGASGSDDDEESEWALGEQADHKENPGYHPTLYNDAPDSRYVDPRYDD